VKQRISIPVAAVLLAIMASHGDCAPGEGTSGGLLLRLPMGARSQGLGGTHGTLPSAPESMLANPAALTTIESFAVEGAYHQGIEDVSYNGILVASPVLDWLSVGAGAATFSAGTIETYDYTGNKYEADLQEDRMGTAGVAAKWGDASFGASVKYYDSMLVGKDRGSMMTADVGASLKIEMGGDRPAWKGDSPDWMILGFSAGNLGAAIDYGGASDPPPLTYRIGLTTVKSLGGEGAARPRALVIMALDVPQSIARPEGRGGLEMRFPFGYLVLDARAGVRFRRESAGYSVGAGIALRGIFLDYAYLLPSAPFGGTHHFSIGLNTAGFRRLPAED
jgi:hypothetical protein